MKNDTGGLVIEPAADGKTVSIYLHSWLGEERGGVTSRDFVEVLSTIKAHFIDFHVNSPGGSVTDGIGIYNALKNHRAKVRTWGDGIVASAATYPLLAGDEIRMSEFGQLMIHDPMMSTFGNADELRKCIEILDRCAETIRNIYIKKTGKPKQTVAEWMAAETWFNPQEALDAGFIDEIYETKRPMNCFDLAGIYRNTPDSLLENVQENMTIRNLEAKLRDVLGLSSRQSKRLLAGGWNAFVRDEQSENLEAMRQHIEKLTTNLQGVFEK